jgi:hypothetical protein
MSATDLRLYDTTFVPSFNISSLNFSNTSALDLTAPTYLSTGVDAFPTAAGGATIFLRFKISGSPSLVTFFSMGDAASGRALQIGYQNSYGGIYIQSNDTPTGTNYYYGSTTWTLNNNWHTLAICIPAAANISDCRLYFDGLLTPVTVAVDGTCDWSTVVTCNINAYVDGTQNAACYIDQIVVFDNDIGDSAAKYLNTYSTPGAGCVLYMNCDEGTGSIVADSSGNGNDAQIGLYSSPVSYSSNTPGAFSSYSLSGPATSRAVSSSRVKISTTFSIAAWIKWIPTSGDYYFFASTNDNTTNDIAVIAGFSNPNDISLYSSTDSYIVTNTVPDGNWHHWMWIYDGTDVKVYIDNTLTSTITIGLTLNSGALQTLYALNWLGTYSPTAKMDDLIYSNHAFSSGERSMVYSGTINVNSFSSPVALWRFEENSGNITHDTGIALNWTTSVDSASWSTYGGSFNGSSSYGKIAYASAFYSATPSKSFWIKGATLTSYGYILSQADSANSSQVDIIWIPVASPGVIQHYDTGTSVTVPDEYWHHIGFDYDGTDVKWYLDGELKSTTTISWTPTVSDKNLFVGVAPAGDVGGSAFLAASVDEIVYGSGFTATDFANLYKTGTLPSGTVASYRFEENGGFRVGNGTTVTAGGAKTKIIDFDTTATHNFQVFLDGFYSGYIDPSDSATTIKNNLNDSFNNTVTSVTQITAQKKWTVAFNFTPITSKIIVDDLIYWLKCDEGSGSIISDSTDFKSNGSSSVGWTDDTSSRRDLKSIIGNPYALNFTASDVLTTTKLKGGSNLTLVGGTSWSSDTPGAFSSYSLSFGGSGDVATVPCTSSIRLGEFTDWALAVWIKIPNLSQSNTYIVSKSINHAGTDWAITYGYSAGTLHFYWDVGGFNLAVAVPDTSWHHYIIMNDSSGGGSSTLYIDGVSAATGSYLTPTNNIGSGTNYGMFLGGENTTNANCVCLIDELKIYNRVLSGGDISNLASGTDVTGDKIVSSWKMEEGTGTTSANDIGMQKFSTGKTISFRFKFKNTPTLNIFYCIDSRIYIGYYSGFSGLYVGTTGGTSVIPFTDDGDWHFLTLRIPSDKASVSGYSSLSDIVWYLDGVNISSTVTDDEINQAGDVYIGAFDGSITYPCDAYMDNLLIFDRDIGDTAAKALYAYSTPAFPCITYLKFDEGTGSTVTDSTTYGNNFSYSGTWTSNTISSKSLNFSNPYALDLTSGQKYTSAVNNFPYFYQTGVTTSARFQFLTAPTYWNLIFDLYHGGTEVFGMGYHAGFGGLYSSIAAAGGQVISWTPDDLYWHTLTFSLPAYSNSSSSSVYLDLALQSNSNITGTDPVIPDIPTNIYIADYSGSPGSATLNAYLDNVMIWKKAKDATFVGNLNSYNPVMGTMYDASTYNGALLLLLNL